jgi:hypothetical protein
VGAAAAAQARAPAAGTDLMDLHFGRKKLFGHIFIRVARFFLVHDTKAGKNVPNEHKMYRMVTKYPKYL